MTPLYLKDATLTIAATGYEAEVSSATLTPATSSAQWKGLTPEAVFTQTSATTWTLDLVLAQDYDDADSLALYLFEHEGETAAMSFAPNVGGGGFTADVIITAGAIGGAVDGFAEATVSLPVQGRPVFAPGP